jgi:uncharacterized protein YccT (UPF0319 family)
MLQLLLPAFQRELLHRLTTRQIMRPRDDCIINNNNGNQLVFRLSKAISASCKAFFIKYSSVKIFSIKQKYSNLFVHLPYVKNLLSSIYYPPIYAN